MTGTHFNVCIPGRGARKHGRKGKQKGIAVLKLSLRVTCFLPLTSLREFIYMRSTGFSLVIYEGYLFKLSLNLASPNNNYK